MSENSQKGMKVTREALDIEHKIKFHSFGTVTLWLKLLIRHQYIVSKILEIYFIRALARV